MENNPFLRPEDDDSDNDKDVSAKKKKKSVLFPRRVPGIQIDKDIAPADRKEQKVARLIDSLFKEKPEAIGREEAKKEGTPPETVPPVEAPDDKVEEQGEESGTEDEYEEETSGLTVAANEEVDTSLEPVDSVAGSGWEEGELGEDEEISLRVQARSSGQPKHEEIIQASEDGSHETEEIPVGTAETSSPVSVEENVDEEELEVPVVSGEAPPDPPEDVPEIASEPPRPPRIPYLREREMHFGGREPGRFSRPEAGTAAREQELDDAEYRGEKRGQRRGVLSGLAAGWFIGRRGKKKMAKGYEKAIKSRDTEIKDLKGEQFTAQERLQAIQRNQETIREALVHKESRHDPGARQAPVERAVQAETAVAQNFSERLVRDPAGEYRYPLMEATAKPENKPAISAVEMAAAPFIFEKNRRTAAQEKLRPKEQLPEDQEINEKTYTTAEGRRIETSSWHRIEVDKKTGKAVDNPELEYGEEFKRETRKEILRANFNNDSPAAVQLGSMATSSSVNSSGATPAPSTSVATVPHHTAVAAQAHKDLSASIPPAEPARQGRPLAQDPIIWAAGISLVVIIYILLTMF